MHLAMLLEEYAGHCVDTIVEEASYDPHRQSNLSGLAVLPPYPADIDWRALGRDLMTAALGFRVHVAAAHREVQASWENEDQFSAWATGAAEATGLGHEALTIAKRMRARFKLPPAEQTNGFDPFAYFVRELAKLRERQAKWAAQLKEKWPVPPPIEAEISGPKEPPKGL
jgi:hypothetical protein